MVERLPPTTAAYYNDVIKRAQPYLAGIKNIVDATGLKPEGSCIYRHGTTEIDTTRDAIRFNLVTLAQRCNRIIEIGFNMGHSALLMLLANPDCVIDCIDICMHDYTILCFEYLRRQFPNRISLFIGHSHTVLKKYQRPLADLIHIDGCHDLQIANIDFFLSKGKIKSDGLIVFDDTNFPHLNYLWSGYIRDKHVIPIEIVPNPFHGIGRLPWGKQKIAVCNLALGAEYKHLVRYGQKGKEIYCQRQMYDWRTDEDVHDSSRPPAWSKVRLILKCLAEHKYDYIVWIDADTHIMNFDAKLEDFIFRLMGSAELMLASDPERINSGVMFIRCTDWAEKFFQLLYDQTDYINHSNWEQEALIHLIDTNKMDCRSHIKILPPHQQTEFNSYHLMYQPGQFLVHLAGCYRNDTNNGLDIMMNRYCPLKMDEDSDDSYRDRLEFIGLA